MSQRPSSMKDHVIIAGFGAAGRFVAEFLQKNRIPFTVVELNPATCKTQTSLGVEILEGNIADEGVLRRAGVETASVLALAIPDEQAALKATEIANAIRPEIHILASTQHTSAGLKALQNGADDVIVAEQAVAQEFYRRIAAFMSSHEPSVTP